MSVYDGRPPRPNPEPWPADRVPTNNLERLIASAPRPPETPKPERRVALVAAPVAQLDADLPPLPKWINDQKGKDPFMDGVIAHIEQTNAKYVERIRHLERELAELKPATSIGDDPEFERLRAAYVEALDGDIKAYSTAKLALIAYIDGRTAGTALPEGLVEVGKLQINPDDPESETGHSYDIVTNYPGHEKLAAMDGARLFAAPSTQEGAND